ncbi:BTAD domain-containing putative transcriptional regulator [Streptomyces sp. NPDC058657]|uniref:BTAD domain-containing putative transcriptional regulator n=1 Tax=unclassified Streptomyces TaxID=2593676 RepID=UPI00365BFED4
MEFRLLGAVSVATETGELPLGPAKRRSVLAALLLRPNTAVPVDQLIDTIWDEAPPAHARTVVQGHVSRLRALLNDGEAAAYGVELATRGRAYVLQMSESLLDAHRFEELVQLAKRQRQPTDAVLMLREALALWRGPALTGTVASEPLAAAAHALEETRLVTVENLAEAYGKLGEHGRAAAVLRTEAVAHPMRETLAAALMLALYRAGRQSDALDWYHRTRRLLADELGVDPGRALQDAYGAILQGDGQPAPVPRGTRAETRADGAAHRSPEYRAPGHRATADGPAAGHHAPGRTGTAPDAPDQPVTGPHAEDRPGTSPHADDCPAASHGPDRTGPARHADDCPAASHGPDRPGPAPHADDRPATEPHAPDRRTPPPGSPFPPVPAAPTPRHATTAPGSATPPAAGLPGRAPSAPPARTGSPATAGGDGRAGGGAPADGTTDSGSAAGPVAAPGADPVPIPVPAPRPDSSTAHVPYTVPELLPRNPRGFLGRRGELAAVGDAVGEGEAPIVLVTGPPGVGKTALALHWAHQRRAEFPGGRLFADLHGFDALADPEPAAVVREFLVALGVSGRAVPETPAAAAALYRRLTADRRLLVVLDNARSSEQVRPLLPSGDDCVTVVTSRNRLDGLIAGDLARSVPLRVLGPDDSTALLAGVLGAPRIAAEPEAARRLAGLCDGLPLALRITAARLATHPDWTLERHSAELADEQGRLALLSVEDRGVAAELRLSVQQLTGTAQLVFRSLGTHTGKTFDRYAAGALAGITPREAGAALDQLAAAHLVQESRPGRFALHDLVRLYARELAEATDGAPGRSEGPLARLVGHYLHTELAANAVAEPGSRPCCTLPDDLPEPSAVRPFATRSEAIEWYEAERDALAGAMAAALDAGWQDRVWRLGLLQWPYVLWRVREQWTPMLEQVLHAAEALDDADAQSRVRALLGWVLMEEGKPEEAYPHLELAPVLAARAGDLVDEAIGRINLSHAQQARGEPGEARDGCVRAAALAQRAGDRPTEMLALQTLAEHCLRAGEPEAALRHSLDGLALGDAEAGLIRTSLLQTAQGESLIQLGRREEGLALLNRAADAAEEAHYYEGACRALDLLWRLTVNPSYASRHTRATTALTTHR